MFITANDTTHTDSHRTCCEIAERALFRYCGIRPDKPQLKGITERDLAALRAQGLMVIKPRKPIVGVSKASEATNPALKAALDEVWAIIDPATGKPPFGSIRPIAAKHGVRYRALFMAMHRRRERARGVRHA